MWDLHDDAYLALRPRQQDILFVEPAWIIDMFIFTPTKTIAKNKIGADLNLSLGAYQRQVSLISLCSGESNSHST